MAKAIDSIGANIAESYGRFNFGEKLQFLYYARGSLFETKYWLNPARIRALLQAEEVTHYATRLSDVARQSNTFASSLKSQRSEAKISTKRVREPGAQYAVNDWSDEDVSVLFTEGELNWLET